MPSPDRKPRQVTPTELLDIREAEWRPRLESRSLVSEAVLPQKHLDQAAVALGRLFTRALDRGRAPNLSRWPACMAAVTAGVATARYSHGAFWPALWETAQVPAPRQDYAAWGRAFLDALHDLGLDAFPDEHLPYVTPILMHAGIPTYCLRDVFALLLERSARTPGLDAPAFHHWAVSGRHRLNSLDVPARRFIAQGGDYALEVVDRCLDLLDRLRDDPDTDCRSVGLPARFLAPAREALEQAAARGVAPARRAGGPRRQQPSRPRLRLDPHAHGVHVVLPVIGDSDDQIVRWHITTDHGTHQVRGHGRWAAAHGRRLPHPVPAARAQPHRARDPRRHRVHRAPAAGRPRGPAARLHRRRRPARPAARPAARPPVAAAPRRPRAAAPRRRHRRGRARRHPLRVGGVDAAAGDPAPRRPDRPGGLPRTPRARLRPPPPRPVRPGAGRDHRGGLARPRRPARRGAARGRGRGRGLADRGAARRHRETAGRHHRPQRAARQPAGGPAPPRARLVPAHRARPPRPRAAPPPHRRRRARRPLRPAFRALAPAGLEPAGAVLSGPDGMDVEPEAQRLGFGEAVLAAQLRTAAAELAVAVRPPHLAVLCTGAPSPQWRPSRCG